MGPEQTETLIAKGRTLTLEDFKYAPGSYERALSTALGSHAQLNDLQSWRRCKVWLVEKYVFLQHVASENHENTNLGSARFWLYALIVRAARAHLRPNSPKMEVG